MKRVKTIALLLAVGMLLSLAACGVPKTAPAETPAAPAPTETPAPAPAATPDPNAVTVTDLAGRPLLLFVNEWSIGMTLERNPGLVLTDFKGNTAA